MVVATSLMLLAGSLGAAAPSSAVQTIAVAPLSSVAGSEYAWIGEALADTFATRLYPGALAAVAHMRRLGPTVILSDGDVVMQPRKIQRSGLWDAVDGRVLIYIHKEQMLDTVERLYPARQYVMVDDKLRILAALKQHWGQRVTSVFPRQGRYARDASSVSAYPPADLSIGGIGELGSYDIGALPFISSTAAKS